MMKMGIRFLGLIAVLLALPTCGRSQVHPTKQVYADWETWPVTTPASVDFGGSFVPFRAVWSREYRNVDGEPRSDRVVLVAEELTWYGRPVISLTLHDVGALDSPDTNARTTSVYVDRQTLALVRATAPRVGTAEDYNVVAVGDDGIITTGVTTASGDAETTEFVTDEPVFGGFNVDFLIWAGMALQTGSKAVAFLYSPGANAFVPSVVRVVGSEDVQLPDGETAQALVVERPISDASSSRAHHHRLLDRPPYLVSRHLIDLDTGETSFHFQLLEWQRLGGG